MAGVGSDSGDVVHVAWVFVGTVAAAVVVAVAGVDTAETASEAAAAVASAATVVVVVETMMTTTTMMDSPIVLPETLETPSIQPASFAPEL